MNLGFLYIVTGEKYMDEAMSSINSLFRHTPNAQVTVITDKKTHDKSRKINTLVFEKSTVDNKWKSNLTYKVNGLLETPYDRTIFMDSDTYFCDSVEELFHSLRYFDLMAMPSYVDCQKPFIDNNIIDGIAEINTGVIAFNNTHIVRDFFRAWKRCFAANFSHYMHDQPAFSEAMTLSGVKFYPLNVCYNFRTDYASRACREKIKILHGRKFDFYEVEKRINRTNKDRFWIPASDDLIFANSRTVIKVFIKKIFGSRIGNKICK